MESSATVIIDAYPIMLFTRGMNPYASLHKVDTIYGVKKKLIPNCTVNARALANIFIISLFFEGTLFPYF